MARYLHRICPQSSAAVRCSPDAGLWRWIAQSNQGHFLDCRFISVGDRCETTEIKAVLGSMNTGRSRKLLMDSSIQPTKLDAAWPSEKSLQVQLKLQNLFQIFWTSPKPGNLRPPSSLKTVILKEPSMWQIQIRQKEAPMHTTYREAVGFLATGYSRKKYIYMGSKGRWTSFWKKKSFKVSEIPN